MSAPAHAEPARPKPRRVLMFLSAVAIGAVLVAFSGLADRARSRQEVIAWTNEQAMAEMRTMGYSILDDHEDVQGFMINYRPPHARSIPQIPGHAVSRQREAP